MWNPFLKKILKCSFKGRGRIVAFLYLVLFSSFVSCFIFLSLAFATSSLRRAMGGNTYSILLSQVKDSTGIQQLVQVYCLLLEVTKSAAELASPHLFHDRV